MENPFRHFVGLDLKRTITAGCPCRDQTKTAATAVERPSSLFHNPHGNLPPRTRYSMVVSSTKTGETGVAIPSKIWTDEDVAKERSSSAYKGLALGALGGGLLAYWFL